MVASVLGKYEVLEEVGQGGMSVVYRGRDTVLGREVAIKVLHPFMAQKTDAKERFYREAMAVAKLSHPNILEIYDYSGETAERAYIVMEFIRGETLAAFAMRTQLRLPELGFLIVRTLASALVHAHDSGIIHRDLKPENVMIRRDGRLKLMDFGIAQMLDADTLTTTGALLGSPAHMSPELIEGEQCDIRSDLFSVGTILYWLMTQKLPFTAPTAPALFKRIVEGQFDDPRVHNPLVTTGMLRVLQKLLKKRRDERYQNAGELIVDLDIELARSGLDAAESALSSFLAAPEKYQEDLSARIKARLREEGDAASAKNNWPAALEAYDRLLSLDPGDTDLRDKVLALGRKQHRQRRLQRALQGAELSLLALVIFVATGVIGWRLSASESHTEPPVAAPLSSRPAFTRTVIAPAAAPVVDIAPVRSAAPSGAPVPQPTKNGSKEQLVEFRLPQWGDLYIDGTLVQKEAVGSTTRSLSVGRHRVRAENPFMEPVEREVDVTAESPPEPVLVKIERFRAAEVAIVAKPGAQAVIDGEARGPAAGSESKPFRVAMTKGDRQVEVRVVVPGEPDRTQAVKVSAGQKSIVNLAQ